MPAYAGNFPWNRVSDRTPSGRNRLKMSAGNYEWDMTEGWHIKRPRGWVSKGKKSGAIEKVQVTAPDGRKVTVYKTNGFEDSIGFHARDDKEMLAYAFSAFDDNNKTKGLVFEQDGVGHILKLEYAQNEMVLRVTFGNGAVCVFFAVPRAVAGQLFHFAQSKSVAYIDNRGISRHNLGVEFWNLVRIRGNSHGSKYPFEYVTHGYYKLSNDNKRYSIVLSDENIKRVLGSKYFTSNLKPGDTVTAILSQEEYDRIEEHAQGKLGVKIRTVQGKDDEYIKEEGVAGDYYSGALKETSLSGIDVILGSDYPRYLELHNRMVTALNEAQKQREKELAGQTINMSEKAKKEIWNKYLALAETDDRYKTKHGNIDYDKVSDAVMAEIDKHISIEGVKNTDYADKRYKEYHEKLSVSPSKVTVTPHQVFSSDKQALNDYLRFTALIRRANDPTKYASGKVGRPWSIEKLKEMANPSNGGVRKGHDEIYKRLINAKEYEAALNFLKKYKHREVYTDENGKSYDLGYKPYAGQYDYLVLGDD